MKRIESNEYFDAVKEYFADHKVPARVISSFLIRCERMNLNYLVI